MQTGNEWKARKNPQVDLNWSYWNHDFGNVCVCVHIYMCVYIYRVS